MGSVNLILSISSEWREPPSLDFTNDCKLIQMGNQWHCYLNALDLGSERFLGSFQVEGAENWGGEHTLHFRQIHGTLFEITNLDLSETIETSFLMGLRPVPIPIRPLPHPIKICE